MTDRRVGAPAGSYGRQFTAPAPTVIIIHSLEAPATPGMAYSLATGWLQHEPVSVHALTDPSESVDMVPLSTIAYHCGGGNDHSIGDEVTGYAKWTTAEWYEPKAFAALRLDAKKVAAQAKALGIPLRWLSIAQMRAGEKGLATHNDARLAWGQTTHTDPGPGFPYAKFLQMCQQWAGGKVTPSTDPNQTDVGPGGAEGDDMYDQGAEDRLNARIDELRTMARDQKPKVDAIDTAIRDENGGLEVRVDHIEKKLDQILAAVQAAATGGGQL